MFDNLRGDLKYLYKVIDLVLSSAFIENDCGNGELNKTTNVNAFGNDDESRDR